MAPWPNLIRSAYFFVRSCARIPHYVLRNFSWIRLAPRQLFQKKKLMGVHHSPVPARINPRPFGVFPDPPLRSGGGGVSPPPPVICQIIELDPKTAFDSPRRQLSEYFVNFYLKVTNDVTRQIKGQLFILCHCWLRRAK